MSMRSPAPRSGKPTRLHSAVFQPIGDEGRAALVERRIAEAIMGGVLAAGERLPAERNHGVQPLGPVGIELHVLDFGQLRQIGAQRFESLCVGVLQTYDEGVGERVFRQRVENFRQPLVVAEALQRRIARDELDPAVLRQQCAYLLLGVLDRVGAGGRLHEHRNFRRRADRAGQPLQIAQQHVAGGRQGGGDAYHQRGQQRVERLAQHLPGGAQAGAHLKTQPVHCSVPCASDSRRGA